MKIRIKKLSLESLAALERERERERESYSLGGRKNTYTYKLTYENRNNILNKVNIKLFSSMFFLCT